jgi:hypothetical protein
MFCNVCSPQDSLRNKWQRVFVSRARIKKWAWFVSMSRHREMAKNKLLEIRQTAFQLSSRSQMFGLD